jgi:hypothetical protein
MSRAKILPSFFLPLITEGKRNPENEWGRGGTPAPIHFRGDHNGIAGRYVPLTEYVFCFIEKKYQRDLELANSPEPVNAQGHAGMKETTEVSGLIVWIVLSQPVGLP